jgi:hypothetical protein
MPINMKLMWNVLENRDHFTSRTHPGSTYSPFLGSPPQTLTMDRAKEARKWKWSPAFMSRSITEDRFGIIEQINLPYQVSTCRFESD